MRPLLIELNRDFRGGQHQALLLLQGLLARGHSPELITVRDSVLAVRAREAGITVHRVSARGRRFSAAMVIRRLMRERPFDIVHANEPHALTAAWLARAHRSAPLVVARRVIFPLSSSYLALARYRAAARVIAVSHCVKDALLLSGLSAEQVAVVPVGVEIPPLSPANHAAARHKFGAGSDKILLGYVAALTPDKGHDLLIRAFAQVRERFPNCGLILAGDGPERARLEALTGDLQLSGAVVFLGFVADVEAIYAGIDLFVFAGLADALPTVLLAAMAHGLPAIGLARGGVPEVLRDGSNGLLVDQPEPASVAAAIVRLLSDPAEAKKIGEAARETIVTGFSADHMVEQTLQVYSDALPA